MNLYLMFCSCFPIRLGYNFSSSIESAPYHHQMNQFLIRERYELCVERERGVEVILRDVVPSSVVHLFSIRHIDCFDSIWIINI